MSHIGMWQLADAVFFRVVEEVNGADFRGNALYLLKFLRRDGSSVGDLHKARIPAADM